jgi:hypothetical protein
MAAFLLPRTQPDLALFGAYAFVCPEAIKGSAKTMEIKTKGKKIAGSKESKGKGKLFPAWKTAQSRKPGPALMDAFVSGKAEAAAIVDSWKFNFPIPCQPADEFDALVERCGSMTFTGRIEEIEINI